MPTDSSPSSPPARLRFGTCLLDLPRRELQRDGSAQPTAPRIFDLLAYLVQHRDRVVSKEELLDRVWRGAFLSESVLARSVMKARQAIGDSAQSPVWIKTVHSIGYRFVGAVQAVASEAVAEDALPTPSAATRRLRLVLLPLRNGTGDEHLGWIETGLHAMVLEALEAERRLSLLPLSAVQQALRVVGSEASGDLQQQASELLELLGAQVSVNAVITRTETGFQLDYRSFGDCDAQGRLHDSSPAKLGQQLAAALEAALYPGDAITVRFASADDLANQAFARALEHCQCERYEAAARLLAVVLDIEPGSLTGQLQLVRVLANLRDPAALSLGDRLLEAATAAGQARGLAAAHEAVGRALYNIGGPDSVARARHHLDEALRLAEPFEGEDWVARIHLGQAIDAHSVHDFERAARFYRRADQTDRHAGNPLRSAALKVNQAMLALAQGDPVSAREWAEASLALGQTLQLPANNAAALTALSMAELALGLVDKASLHGQQAVALLPQLPANESECAAWALLAACDVGVEAHRADDSLAPSFALMAAMLDETAPRVVAVREMAQGLHAEWRGYAEDALAFSVSAAEQAQACGQAYTLHEMLSRRLAMLLRQGCWEDAAYAREEILQLPSLADDFALQALLHHARGAWLHSEGRRDEATQALGEVLALSPLSRHGARARLDLAWLAVEAGALDRARAILRDLGPWLQQHPAGRALVARMYAAQGLWNDAATAQESMVQALGPRAAGSWRELSESYRRGAGGLPASLAPLVVLPTWVAAGRTR